MMHLQTADIVLVEGHNLLSKLIKKFTRSPGEPRTRITHVALAIDSLHVIEATSGGVAIRPYTSGQVWRPQNIPSGVRKAIAANAIEHLGEKYGWGKIALAGLDGLLGGAYVFRRFIFADKWPVCSYLVAGAYASQGYTFGVDARAASPDDIADFVQTRTELYAQVHPGAAASHS